MALSITLYVERGDEEIELEIHTASYTRGRRGRTNCLPELAHPPEPSEVEIGDIFVGPTLCAGETGPTQVRWTGELDAAEEERALEALYEAAEEDAAARYEEAGDRAYDDMRDREIGGW